jgi:hypothetical protein
MADVNRAEIPSYPISKNYHPSKKTHDIPILVDKEIDHVKGMQDVDNHHRV